MNSPRSYRTASSGTLRMAQQVATRERKKKRTQKRVVVAALLACASFVLILSLFGGGGSALPETVAVSRKGVRPETEIRCPRCRKTVRVRDLSIRGSGLAQCPECDGRFHIGHAYQKTPKAER